MPTVAAEEDFRDRISTVDHAGKRLWLYPKKPKGKLTHWRTLVNTIFLTILFTGPFLRINGQPVLMLNLIDRKFIVFGQIFWPQDFYLFGLATIVGFICIVLFTVVYGRIFCGWICPQTIFMEGIFRKIEYLIEGDWTAQKKLANQQWDNSKIFKKGVKHIIFFTISFIIANTFLAYIIGSDDLFKIISEPPKEHLSGLISLLVFTFIFYYVFAFFREQVCTNVCPYGRMQGVLLDSKSIVVAYDYKRGESRGKIRKGEDRKSINKGDCVDCKLCVNVCPTGIDIRNGTQLECINCTACIDACNSIMANVGLAKGLIRYDSEENIANNKKGFNWSTRTIAYTVVLLALSILLTALLIMRSEVDATILRTPGMMYQHQAEGAISNLYNVKIINKTNTHMPLTLKMEEGIGNIQVIGNDLFELPEQGVVEGAIFLILSPDDISGISQKVTIGIYHENRLLKKVKTKFIGPSH